MKLELKHLAPYLPYELILKIVKFNKTETLTALNGSGTIYTIESNQWRNIKSIRPILRPLSDLTKEIEHNGERFVPIVDLCNSELYGYSDLRYMINSNNFNSIESLSFKSFNKIIEWHFDVFGLIDAGLAIDINTLTN